MADKATRIIAENMVESFPQCVLQSYIYVVVIRRSEAGTATGAQLAMLASVEVLPTSILVSTLAMLKTCVYLRERALQCCFLTCC